jgi:WhiB family redox-sensing transcriptional regulator
MTEWMSAGVCAQTDPEAFHPDKSGSVEPAKAVCVACPVRVQCLSYALETNQRFGVWGGHSARERKALRAVVGANSASRAGSPAMRTPDQPLLTGHQAA